MVAALPTGQITNHYHIKDWDFFYVRETERALCEYDGHTTSDVAERLASLCAEPEKLNSNLYDKDLDTVIGNSRLLSLLDTIGKLVAKKFLSPCRGKDKTIDLLEELLAELQKEHLQECKLNLQQPKQTGKND